MREKYGERMQLGLLTAMQFKGARRVTQRRGLLLQRIVFVISHKAQR